MKHYELENIIEKTSFIHLDISEIHPSPLNNYEISDIDEMKRFIQSCGLITPLSVVGPDKDGKYEILSGERRYTALKELMEENPSFGKQIPCYLVGTADMPTLEKKLLIEVANITNRGNEGIQMHRFEVVRLIKELEDTDAEKYKGMNKAIHKYLKVSDRYGRMYNQIFKQAGDGLMGLAESGDIRINDASRLSTLPVTQQDAAVEEIKTAKSSKEKADIVSKYTQKNDAGKSKKTPQKMSVSLEDLDSGLYNDLMDDDYSGMDLNIDRSGLIGKQKRIDEQNYEEDYRNKLMSIIEWTEKMMKKAEPTDEEWDAIDACRRLAEKFQ